MTCPQCERLLAAIRGALKHLATAHIHSNHVSIFECIENAERELWEPANTFSAPSPLQSIITWIPVSERLPEDRTTVPVVNNGEFDLATLWMNQTDLGDCWFAQNHRWLRHVTHWGIVGELPPPPPSEEETG